MKARLERHIATIQHALDEAGITVEVGDASDDIYEDAIAWVAHITDNEVRAWQSVVRLLPATVWEQYKLYTEWEQERFKEVRLRNEAAKNLRKAWRKAPKILK